MPSRRPTSPLPGCSTLMTSAPISAISRVAYGPCWAIVKSRTRIPSSGPGITDLPSAARCPKAIGAANRCQLTARVRSPTMRANRTEEPLPLNAEHAEKPIEVVLDLPIRYIDRSRAYYLALGYDNPYRWAHHDDAPFAALNKPLTRCRVALITTAAPFLPGAGDQGLWAPYNAAAKFTEVYSMPIEPPPDLRISHLGYDRTHTSAKDINTYFPLERIKETTSDGRIGELNSRLYAVPTLRSQRLTTERDAPQILELCREDAIDAAILVPT